MAIVSDYICIRLTISIKVISTELLKVRSLLFLLSSSKLMDLGLDRMTLGYRCQERHFQARTPQLNCNMFMIGGFIKVSRFK